MTFVLGRERGLDGGPTVRLGTYRASDGSGVGPVHLDLDRPHAVTIVGKRGYGKSYTLGVIAEGLARAGGTGPVLVDAMGEFGTLTADASGDPVPATVVDEPRVAPSSLSPRTWCRLLGLAPDSPAGSLLWRAASEGGSISEMRTSVQAVDASAGVVRTVRNHLEMAQRWGVFDPAGVTATALADGTVTVVDVSTLDRAPANAVVRAICDLLYRGRIEGQIERLPWLLVDEAHAFFDGVAEPGLRRLLTRGRTPGVSLVCATQRPSAVPAVGRSQTDLLVAHRLTSGRDIEALTAAQPTYLTGSLTEQLPTGPGEVVVVDDTTESVHGATVRDRVTPHAGDSPRASAVASDE
ncbi:ATP-binding protein [Halomicrobium katesii]|uniref:ATP-binding protein n=1 Tax=Halomicrobium katesii TaxID=437163 RepID=UPI00037D13AC|nr:DUF87 domain-containing protein [Halomicrobium katesii]